MPGRKSQLTNCRKRASGVKSRLAKKQTTHPSRHDENVSRENDLLQQGPGVCTRLTRKRAREQEALASAAEIRECSIRRRTQSPIPPMEPILPPTQPTIISQPTINRRRKIKNLGFLYDPNQSFDLANVGKCSNVCPHCFALKFPKETDGMCCNKGKVKLPPLRPPPMEIQIYLDQPESEDSTHFFKNIRKYNSLFQMTSFRSKKSTGERDLHKHPGNVGYSTTFSLQGQIYHTVKSLQPMDAEEPSFLNLYFYDGDQIDIR